MARWASALLRRGSPWAIRSPIMTLQSVRSFSGIDLRELSERENFWDEVEVQPVTLSRDEISKRNFLPSEEAKVLKEVKREDMQTITKELSNNSHSPADLEVIFNKHVSGVIQEHLLELMKRYCANNQQEHAIRLFKQCETFKIEPDHDLVSLYLRLLSEKHDSGKEAFEAFNLLQSKFIAHTEDYNNLLKAILSSEDRENLSKFCEYFISSHIMWNQDTVQLLGRAYFKLKNLESLQFVISQAVENEFNVGDLKEYENTLRKEFLL